MRSLGEILGRPKTERDIIEMWRRLEDRRQRAQARRSVMEAERGWKGEYVKIENLIALEDLPGGLSKVTLPEGKFLTLVGTTGVALERLGEGEPDPEPDPETGVWRFPGLVHQPTQETPDHGIDFRVPPGTYQRIDFQMEFVHTGWSDNPSGRHLVVWFVKERNFDMIFQLAVVGPPKSKWLWRHGFGIRQAEKPKIQGPYPFSDGNHTLKYTYQAGGPATLEVWRDGELIISKTDAATVDQIVVEPGEVFRIGLGNAAGNADEPPTIGWEYRNIEIRVS